MTRVRRSRTKGSAKDQAKSVKTKRYAKDTDQIHEELKRVQAGLPRTSKAATTIQEADPEDLPGGGDFPCIECSRHFISQDALEKHRTTKIHRRRLKELRDEPYSQKEADAAAGLGTDNGRSSRRSAAQHQKHQETAMIDLLPQAA